MTRILSDACLSPADIQSLLADTPPDVPNSHIRTHLNQCAVCRQKVEELLDREGEVWAEAVCAEQRDVKPWMNAVLQSVADRPMDHSTDDGSSSSMSQTVRFPQASTNPAHCGRLDEFEIIEHIASGATGHLFRANDTTLNRTVAIKVLRAELCVSGAAKQRFLQEASAIAAVHSEYIVNVHEVRERSDFPPCIIMEFVAGNSLQQQLDDGRRPDYRTTVTLICQVLQGLSAAHQNSVIHRDVKPGNIVIQQQPPRARLVDFGLARLEEQSCELTSPGSIAGTPTYMAPEQILDAHAADARSDVYSVGAVLYQLLTGDLPFRGSVRMVLQQVLHDEPRPLRHLDDQIPRDLQTICLKAMSKSPSHRYATATAFREDLQRWLDGLPVLARPVGILGRLLRWKARNPVIANLFLVIFVLLMAMISLWGRFTLEVTAARDELAVRNRDLRESNELLNEANDRIVKERAAAVSQAERADKQANLAFRVLNRLTFGLQNALADRPDLQQQLLNASIDDLKQLSEETPSDSAVGVTLAVAFLRAGEAFRQTGQFDRAEQCFQDAEGTLHAMSVAVREEPDVIQCAIWLHLSRGNAGLAAGEPDTACPEFAKAVQLCRKIEALHPNRVLTMHAHALAILRGSRLDCAATTTDEGQLLEAIGLLGECLKLDESDHDVRFDLAAAHLQRARSMESIQLSEAIDAALQAVELFLDIDISSHRGVAAAENAVNALAFIAAHQHGLHPSLGRRLRDCRNRLRLVIEALVERKYIDHETGFQWGQQLTDSTAD